MALIYGIWFVSAHSDVCLQLSAGHLIPSGSYRLGTVILDLLFLCDYAKPYYKIRLGKRQTEKNHK